MTTRQALLPRAPASDRPEAIRRRLLGALVLAMIPFTVLMFFQGIDERRHAAQQARAESRRLVRLLAADHEQLWPTPASSSSF